MPQIQNLDLRTEGGTPLEKTLKAFSTKQRQEQVGQTERDQLSDIYQKYRNEEQDIDDVIWGIQTAPGISPTTRVNAAKMAQEHKKINIKKQEIVRKQTKEDEADKKELAFIESVKDKKLKQSEIYPAAREFGLSSKVSRSLSDVYHRESKENRLSEESIRNRYRSEIVDLDKRIKDERSDLKKKPLQEEKRLLKENEKKDIKRLRGGEVEFDLAFERADAEVAQDLESEQLAEATKKKSLIPEAPNAVTEYTGIAGSLIRSQMSKAKIPKAVEGVQQMVADGDDPETVVKSLADAGWNQNESAEILTKAFGAQEPPAKKETISVEKALRSFNIREVLKLTPDQISNATEEQQDSIAEKFSFIGEQELGFSMWSGLSIGSMDKLKEYAGIETPDFVTPGMQAVGEMMGSLPLYILGNAKIVEPLVSMVSGGKVYAAIASILGNTALVSTERSVHSLIKEGELPELKEYTGYLTDIVLLETFLHASGKLNPFKKNLEVAAKAEGVTEETLLKRKIEQYKGSAETISEDGAESLINDMFDEFKGPVDGAVEKGLSGEVSEQLQTTAEQSGVPSMLEMVEEAPKSVEKPVTQLSAPREEVSAPTEQVRKTGTQNPRKLQKVESDLKKITDKEKNIVGPKVGKKSFNDKYANLTDSEQQKYLQNNKDKFSSAEYKELRSLQRKKAALKKNRDEIAKDQKKKPVDPDVETASFKASQPKLAAKTPKEKNPKTPKEKKAKSKDTKEKSPKTHSFKTEKGSVYSVEGNTTVRNKAYRKEHGATDKGLQPKSDRTVYVSPEDSIKLSEFQTGGESKKIVRLSDGRIGVQYTSGPNKGKVEARTVVKFKQSPKVGLVPVELFNKGEKVHFGSKISKVSGTVIETTGKSAADQNVFTQYGTDKALTGFKRALNAIGGLFKKKPGKGNLSRINTAVSKLIKSPKPVANSLKRNAEVTNVAVLNFLSPLEKVEANLPINKRPSSHMKRAQAVASEINSVLENGIYSDITNNLEHQSLKDVYGDRKWIKFTEDAGPGEFSMQELSEYRTSRVALRRQSEGITTGVDTAAAKADVERLAPKYKKTADAIRQYQRNLVTSYGQDTLGPELIKVFNDKYYSALYRVMDHGADSMLVSGSLTPKRGIFRIKGGKGKLIDPSESDVYNTSMIISTSRKNSALLKYYEGIQEGTLPGRIIKGKHEPVPKSVSEAVGKDVGSDKLVETMFNQTRRNAFTPDENVLQCWVKGKPVRMEVPPEIYNTYKANINPVDTMGIKILKSAGKVFSSSISMEPFQALSIIRRDAQSAFTTSKSTRNPIKYAKTFAGSVAEIYFGSAAYKKFLNQGGDLYSSRISIDTQRARSVDSLITPGRKGVVVPLNKMISYFKKVPEALNGLSMAVPYTEYKLALKKFGNTESGRMAAAMEARAVTYDPFRKGSNQAIRNVGIWTSFWNVSLQDFSMSFKNLRNKEAWIKGSMYITAPTLMLKMYNTGNPDYDAETPENKARYWYFYTPFGVTKVAVPWLLATQFKVIPEMMFDMVQAAAGRGDATAKEAWQGLYRNFLENMGGELNPLIKHYIESTTGKSPGSPASFIFGQDGKSPDVIPRRIQDLSPEYQYTSKTSQLARWFGKKWGISPAKIDRTLKTYGSIIAADVLALTDEVAYWSGMADDNRPELREKNYLLLGRYISESTPKRTKHQEEFYEELDKQVKQRATQKIDPEYGEEYLNQVDLVAYNRDISKSFKEIRRIEDSTEITPSGKTILLNEQQQQINRSYKEATKDIHEAKQANKR